MKRSRTTSGKATIDFSVEDAPDTRAASKSAPGRAFTIGSARRAIQPMAPAPKGTSTWRSRSESRPVANSQRLTPVAGS